jgi:hypothetical protein
MLHDPTLKINGAIQNTGYATCLTYVRSKLYNTQRFVISSEVLLEILHLLQYNLCLIFEYHL